MSTANAALEEKILEESRHVQAVRKEVAKVVVGQDHMVDRLLVGLFTGGHVLLEGVPGLAKTLTIGSLSQALHLAFQRIQFTPDLLPADLVGTLIYNQRETKFEVKKGPIFANIVLADEINRSPAKVQSALLEAMQERQVTIGDTTYPLDKPFLVLATQNPVDQEGTYPLPEAQIDRFMMRIFVGYPSRADELEIMRRMAKTERAQPIQAVMGAEEIFAIRGLIDQIALTERLENYIVDLVMATRYPDKYNLADLKTYIQFGASPRATIALNLASRCEAFLQGRSYVLPEDIKAVALDVLNHRLILTYEADAEEVPVAQVVDSILKAVPI
jgi:MoxR-like ATPase